MKREERDKLRQDEARGQRAMLMAAILGVLVICLAMCSCNYGRINTAAKVSRTQLLVLKAYVETANEAIERDTTLSDEDRESWQAVGIKLIRNESDILELLDKDFTPEKQTGEKANGED